MPREHYQQTVFNEHDHLASMMFLLVVTSLLQSKLFQVTQRYPNVPGHNKHMTVIISCLKFF